MSASTFVRATGAALAAGGAVAALLNLGLTPIVVKSAPVAETMTSTAFLLRQSLSALAAGLQLLGCVGLYLSQDARSRRSARIGAVCFVLAFAGCALVVAWEWVDIFVLRDLALRVPDALKVLDEGKGLSLYDLGALIAISLYAIGWIALATWTAFVTPTLRTPAVVVVLGLFAVPLLSAAIGPRWGGALGNGVLGGGLFLLGLGVRRRGAR